MYNRYIPQPDGSFRRSKISDVVSPAPADIPADQQPAISATHEDMEPEHSAQKQEAIHQVQQKPQNNYSMPPKESGSVGTFLRSLLPQNFDTEDLIVVLLLMLMSGNRSNDQNAALLTLGIYLFM